MAVVHYGPYLVPCCGVHTLYEGTASTASCTRSRSKITCKRCLKKLGIKVRAPKIRRRTAWDLLDHTALLED